MDGIFLDVAQHYGPWAVVAVLVGWIFWQKLTRIERAVLQNADNLARHEEACHKERVATAAYRAEKATADMSRDREIAKLNRRVGLNGSWSGANAK